jgi:ATP-dependent DNA ligase
MAAISGRPLGFAADSFRLCDSEYSLSSRLELVTCPFVNLPDRGKGRWGEGLTAEDMEQCRWLKPRLVASIEFLEWTPENRLRHPKFVALRDDREAKEVVREAYGLVGQ